jgi:thioredoxin reductase
MPKPTGTKLLILGAGPVGLEAALRGVASGFDVTVIESGAQVAEYVGRWGFAKMFTPFGWNSTTLGLQTLLADRLAKDLPKADTFQSGKEFRETYLVPLSQCAALRDRIKLQTTVLSVGRYGARKGEAGPRTTPFRVVLRGPNNVEAVESADLIFDCTGTYSRPNWLGDGGTPALGELASRQFIPYWLEDVRGSKKPQYLGKSILVIGHGASAASTIGDLSTLAEENASTWITWLTGHNRGVPIARIPNDPLRERDRQAARANGLATRGEGNIEHVADVRIDEVHCAGADRGYRVVGRIGKTAHTWEAEKLIANIGYKPDITMTSELNVGEPTGAWQTAEPGYYVFGAKSHGRNGQFLLRDGYEQLNQVFGILAKQAVA